MTLTHEDLDTARVVTVNAARIDAAGAIRFKEDMRLATDCAADRIILDLGQVEFIDSSGLGAVVAAMKQVGPLRRLDLAALSPAVEKVFRLTRMDTVFRIYPSVAEARADGGGPD
jgi:anti-sigma B factor antagonist